MAWTPKYVSSALGSGGNDGSTPADALRGTSAIKTGLETNWAAEIKVYYRRTSEYDEGVVGLNADIAPTDDGTAALPCYHIGWPRAAIPNTTITEGVWTNGSRLVTGVVGITPGLRAHGARWATAPNGKKYLITAVLWEFDIDGMAAGAEFAVGEILTNTTQTKKGKVWAFTDNADTTGTIQAVVDSSTAWVNNDNITSDGGGDAELSENATAIGFIIDREYAGSTVSGTNGKFQIDADEDYADRPQAGIDAGWDADSHDLPKIDFNDEAYQLIISSDNYFSIRNFYFENSADANGIVYASNGLAVEFIGCIFKQTAQNTPVFGTRYILNATTRFIIEGAGTGSAQVGVYTLTSFAFLNLMDGAIYNCGDIGIDRAQGDVTLNNVNVGSEISNGDDDIYVFGKVVAKDVILGGTNGYVQYTTSDIIHKSIQIENYQKVLGNHKAWFFGGTWESIAVTSTAANKKLSDTVLKITPDYNYTPSVDDWKTVIFDGEFALSSGSQTIKFWIYNNLGQTLNDTTAKDNIYLKATYVDSYDDTTEYTNIEAFSTEIDIADAADADDWDYIQVTVNPATASKVRVQLIWSGYDATDYLLVDPEPVIS